MVNKELFADANMFFKVCFAGPQHVFHEAGVSVFFLDQAQGPSESCGCCRPMRLSRARIRSDAKGFEGFSANPYKHSIPDCKAGATRLTNRAIPRQPNSGLLQAAQLLGDRNVEVEAADYEWQCYQAVLL
jgi:hypothetical protein